MFRARRPLFRPSRARIRPASSGAPTVLVTGFGPFRDVVDNPASRAARAVNGRIVRGVRILGIEVPVGYAEGSDATIAAARAAGATAVIGLGRHPNTPVPRVEVLGYNQCFLADIQGKEPATLEEGGPERVRTNIDARALSAAIRGRVTEDAGRYVCNAWVYRVTRALAKTCQVGFIHVPPTGIDANRLATAIGRLWGSRWT